MKRLPLMLAIFCVILAQSGNCSSGPNYFTELFSDLDNDLAFKSFTFTPDGSASHYAVCRRSATNFPTDPAGGTALELSDDSFSTITLPGTNTVAVYGTRTNKFHIGSNGYLTFQSGDINFSESLSSHFLQPRVSALFDDLHPPAGSVTWKTLSNRVAVTYLNVPERSTTNKNSFQIELFFEGAIRMTYLRIDARDGLVGLSAGGGNPPDFVESDFSSFPLCEVNNLALAIPATALEGSSGVVGQITLPSTSTTNVVISLTSSDTTEVTVPPTVTIPAGTLNTAFNLTIVDDTELDGSQSATITVSAPGYVSASATIVVLDNETAVLQLTLPNSVSEGDGSATGTVQVSAPPTSDVLVQLHSSDITEITVPPSVMIPAGQTSASFSLNVIDDVKIDGARSVTITASVPNWTPGTAQIFVLDNENKNLILTIPTQAIEGNGILQNAGRVQIAGTLTTNLNVSLFSSDTSELTVPPSITIPAGATSSFFNITIVDDLALDGAQTVTVTAIAPGFVNGSAQIIIYDNESPAVPTNPSPAHLTAGISAMTGLSWSSGETTPQANVYDVYLGTSPTLTTAQFLGSTTNTTWELPILAPLTTYYWQIVSRREGQTASPVWQFTTRGVNHFEVSAIASPQQSGVPFPATIIAKDEFNRTVTNFSGPVQLTAVIGTNQTLRMLTFTGYADLAQEYPRTLAAIRNHFTNFVETSTTATNAATLSNLLTDKHLFLIVEQETATATILSNLATNWTGLLSNFTFNGGSVIVCSYQASEHLILANSGLLHLTKLGSVASTNLVPVSHPLTAGVETAFQGHYISFYTTTNGTPVVTTGDSAAVITRKFGAGNITLIGTDFYTNTPMDRILANAVSQAYSNALPQVSMSPAMSSTFTNGVWTGMITIHSPGGNITLRANESGHSGMSNPFEVMPPDVVVLQVQRIGSELLFEWLAPKEGVILEFTESLVSPVVWQPATNAIPTATGMKLPLDSENHEGRFFRLTR